MSKVKIILKNPLAYFILLVLLLDLAALDDITTGNEPNYWGEWDVLIASVFVFGLMAYSRLGKPTR